MHRRALAVALLIASLATAVPTFATPRRDNDPTFVDRIVRTLKKILNPTLLDYNDPIPPKP